MTFHINLLLKNKLMRAAYICVGLMLSSASPAALVDLATAPLANSTTSLVLPNLMYILDNSGSMRSDFMPDYVNDTNKCKSTATGTAASIFSAACGYGDPAYNLKDFNTLYYNPEITYLPALNSDGTTRPSMNSANTAGWTNVPNDPYGIRNVDQLGNNPSTSISLIPNLANTQGYPADVWCNTTAATTADLSDPAVCNRNDQWVFPTSVFNSQYTLRTYPYYFTNTPSEYCTDKNLTTCQATASATYNVPATLRWCNNSARTNCQAKYVDGTYIFAKWLGITTGTVSGTIKIRQDPTPHTPATSVTPLQITNVTVGGVRIIPTTPVPALTITNTTLAAQRASLASALASNINSFISAPDYTATATGDTVTVTPVSAGALTATIVVSTTTATAPLVTTTQATGRFRISSVTTTAANISSIRVGSVEILNQTINTTTTGSSAARRAALATAIVNRVNSFVSSPDYTAVSDGASTPTITFTAVVGGTAGNGSLSRTVSNTANIVIDSVVNLAGGGTTTTTQTYILPTTVTNFNGGVPVVATFNRVDIEPSTPDYPKAATRTDCTGAVGPAGCSYEEEMTNFANWYSYYRTRMQMMKTSTSRAFKDIDTRFRVGFITINNASTNYLPIAKFDETQKDTWYTRLFAADGNSGTPLRSAITTTGRIFAGRGSAALGNSADPMQYSCQQNFALLTTDGYWNTDTTTTVRDVNGTGSVGNMDGGTTPRPLFEGTSPTFTASNTLADATKYYYDTDLRDASLSNCTGSEGVDVCTNNVFVTSTDNNVNQHMTTFTLGLGVDGSLNYTSDYKTQTVGDFNDLKNGTINWPVPTADAQTTVDDLWHAAVNGRGTYFSAKNPTQLTTSLAEALSSITSKVGAGAAAATSTLNPVSGDNFAYVASYATVKWTGNIEGRTIDIATGEVSVDASWCTENIAAGICSSPGTVVSDTTGSSVNYFCSTPGRTLATCPAPGILDGTNCKVEIASACTGTMPARVAATSDDRKILMQSSTGLLVPFNLTNITSAGESGNFQSSFLASNLSQWTDLTTAQQASLTPDKLVNFLRGQTGFEDRATNVVGTVDNRLFRFREATIGDPIESTPAFNGIPKATYTDPGYGSATVPGTFAYTQSLRDGTVYIGTNDGMLHAFDADNGVERWAYVPTMVMPKLWKLADKNYANMHTNYVNGDPIINDVCVANCSTTTATWKTILVGGLNGGGTGYYALDITDPENPISLWEFDTSDDADLGYTFGNPIITKKADGTWVVLVTSGYNNVSGSVTTQGKGFLYVLDVNPDILNPGRAKILTKYNTGDGNATTPSGLAKISAFITDAQKNNAALYVYGGDLLGNLWRFDINSPQSSTNPFKLAKLLGPGSVAQPITVKPELSEVEGKRIVFIGTGKYLEAPDLTNTATQTLYAITDANATTTLNNPRGSADMVSQTISNSGASRLVTNNPVSYATKRGWYIDLPDTGERQNVPSQLVFGTLLVPTIVPSNTVCSPGGYGWLNFINFRTGAIIAQSVVASKTNAPIVGINVLYVNGKPKVSIVTADNPTPEFPVIQPEFLGGSVSGFQDRRVIWRELIEEQQ